MLKFQRRMQDTEEIWKDIPGYEGFYQASNLGKLKRLKTLSNHSSGKGLRLVRERIIKQTIGKRFGYKHATTCINGIVTSNRIHILIAKTFIPNPENKPQVNHIDHNKTNNRVDNLEWCTPSENKIHTIKAGRVKTTHADGIIDFDKAEQIRSLWKLGEKQCTIAEKFKIHPSIVSRVVNRKRRYKFI